MTWLISEAMMKAYGNLPSSPELAAEYSAGIFLAGEQSAQSSGSPTQLAYLSHGKTTAFSRLSRFGMMCKPLTDAHGAALLTSYLAAFHAKTSVLPEVAQASKANAAECGSRWPELSVRFDPVSSSWKTAHCLWEEDLPWSSVTLPPWGITRSGSVYRHPTAERPISGIVSGLWATPSATDGNRGGAITERMTGISLAQQINTPGRWQTPTASQHKGWSKNHNRANSDDRLDYTAERQAYEAGTPGRLNPMWVEWLMGWPLGWTDLKPLAMDKFHEWQRQHSPCLPEIRKSA